MGIRGIEVLITPDLSYRDERALETQRRIEGQLQQELVEAHHRGEHPFGSMVRACPLCQQA